MNLYPCSGCGSRHCDGRCFLESAADYPEVLEHQRINDTLAPVAHDDGMPQPWEIVVLFVGCIFLGYALAVQF